MVMARWTFDILATMRTRCHPQTFVPMCAILGDASHDWLYKYFGILSGRALLFRSHARAVSNEKFLHFSPSLSRYPELNRFLSISRIFIWGFSMAWMIRSRSSHHLHYGLFCTPLVKQEVLISFWYKTVLLRHGIYQMSRLIGENYRIFWYITRTPNFFDIPFDV
jgi:hypothetical protein